MNKKTILILGGGGYVGCNLVRKLLNFGHNVIVYDLFLYKKEIFLDLKDNKNNIVGYEKVSDPNDPAVLEKYEQEEKAARYAGRIAREKNKYDEINKSE